MAKEDFDRLEENMDAFYTALRERVGPLETIATSPVAKDFVVSYLRWTGQTQRWISEGRPHWFEDMDQLEELIGKFRDFVNVGRQQYGIAFEDPYGKRSKSMDLPEKLIILAATYFGGKALVEFLQSRRGGA